ncbi:MAG: hypothetical protein E3J64_00575 [Anaerolineales bacterium]|nr:MAG: hypothetical protein E3J64_00575 [Anaerolineales bacterium]
MLLRTMLQAGFKWLLRIGEHALRWAWEKPAAGLIVAVVLAPVAQWLATRDRRWVRAIGEMLRGVSYTLGVTAGVSAAKREVAELGGELLRWLMDLPGRGIVAYLDLVLRSGGVR